MDREHFEKTLEGMAPPGLFPFVQAALDEFEPPFYRFHANDVIQRAGELAEQEDEGGMAGSILDAQTVVTSEILADVITPWVFEVRTEIEESANVDLPFPSYVDAVEWIERQRRPEGAKYERALFYYRPKSGLNEKRPAPVGSPLDIVARTAQEMAEATGILPKHLTAFILADIPPKRSPVLLERKERLYRIPGREKRPFLSRPEVVITIHEPLTEKRLAAIGSKVNDFFGDTVSPLTDRDLMALELYEEVIEEMGEPQERGDKQARYERLRQKFAEHGVHYKRGGRGAERALRVARERRSHNVRMLEGE